MAAAPASAQRALQKSPVNGIPSASVSGSSRLFPAYGTPEQFRACARGALSGFFLKIPFLSLKSTAGCGLCSGTVIEKKQKYFPAVHNSGNGASG